jgi:hypothetical protein
MEHADGVKQNTPGARSVPGVAILFSFGAGYFWPQKSGSAFAQPSGT